MRISYAKVAEFQRRGAIHFHAVIRLDAATECRCPDCLAPPPDPFGADLLERPAAGAVGLAGDDVEHELVHLGLGLLELGDELVVLAVLLATLLLQPNTTVGVDTLVDVLWPLWDEENRALHDFVVDTRTIVV